MINDLPYHVVFDILKKADLPIESKITFQIQKPIIRNHDLDENLNAIYKKRLHYLRYDILSIWPLVSMKIDSNIHIIVRFISSRNNYECTISKFYYKSNIIEYSKTYDAHTGELLREYKL